MDDPLHKQDLPFPKRWKGYLAIKIILLICALLLAFRLGGLI